MTGMEMMLKQFGIDPEKIKAEFAGVLKQTTDNVMVEVNAIKAAQVRIEEKLDKVLSLYSVKPEHGVPTLGLEIVGVETSADWTRESGSMDSMN